MEEDQRYAESGHTANYLDELISKKSSDDNQNKTPGFFPKDVWLFNYCMSETHACQHSAPCNTTLQIPWEARSHAGNAQQGWKQRWQSPVSGRCGESGALPAGGRYKAVVKVIDMKTHLIMLVNLPHLETTGFKNATNPPQRQN